MLSRSLTNRELLYVHNDNFVCPFDKFLDLTQNVDQQVLLGNTMVGPKLVLLSVEAHPNVNVPHPEHQLVEHSFVLGEKEGYASFQQLITKLNLPA
jgi:hypothetical protein